MTLLDAYALIGFLAGGPAAPQVRSILRGGEAAVTTANLVETLDVSARMRGVAVARTIEVLDPLLEQSLTPIPLDPLRALRAAEVRARHYDRTKRPISLADAILVASAAPGDLIATSDRHVLAVAGAEQVGTIELPEER